MQIINSNESLLILFTTFTLIFILFIVFYILRFKKIAPNEYVIWLRNGRIKRVGTGGSGLLMPFFDKVIVLPISMINSQFSFEIYNYKDKFEPLFIDGEINWRISDPELFFAFIGTGIEKELSNQKSINLTFKSIIREHLENKDFDSIYQRSQNLRQGLSEFLNEKLNNFGITVETVELEKVKKGRNQNLN